MVLAAVRARPQLAHGEGGATHVNFEKPMEETRLQVVGGWYLENGRSVHQIEHDERYRFVLSLVGGRDRHFG